MAATTRALLVLLYTAPTRAQVLIAANFVKYVGYDGALTVKGSVGPLVTTGTEQAFPIQLSGLDPGCYYGALSGVANSCGLHIHVGHSCDSDAGSHYYNRTVLQDADPWGAISYSTMRSGPLTRVRDDASVGTAYVETGLLQSEIAGHTMIVHDAGGRRIACAALAEPTEATLTAAGFVPYHGYGGGLQVSGTIGPITTSASAATNQYGDRSVGYTQTFYFSLKGVDPACASGPGSAPDSCGLHVHRGTSCIDPAGRELYNLGWCPISGPCYGGGYPWEVGYTADADGSATGYLTVRSGFDSADMEGRPFIVHDFDGHRVGCALLSTASEAAALSATAFVRYASYTGPLTPRGSVHGRRVGGATDVAWQYNLVGLDPACTSGADPSVPNSCGVHVHEGRTCAGDAGGHFFTGAVTMDPWASVAYTVASAALGNASAEVSVDTGGTMRELNGRSVVVHDHAGARIACAILGDSSATAGGLLTAGGFVTYAGASTGDSAGVALAGQVSVGTSGGTDAAGLTAFALAFHLSGVDALCAAGNDPSPSGTTLPLRCGIRVYSQRSCASSPGEPMTGDGAGDPWANVSYMSDSAGVATGSLSVSLGLTLIDLSGRALIVHDSRGGHVGCALLGTGHDANRLDASAFRPYDGYAGVLRAQGAVSYYAGDFARNPYSGGEVIEYDLRGVDERCQHGAVPGVLNSCGSNAPDDSNLVAGSFPCQRALS